VDRIKLQFHRGDAEDAEKLPVKVGKWESGKVRGVGSHRHTLTPSHFLTLVHAPHLCGENIENNSVQILRSMFRVQIYSHKA